MVIYFSAPSFTRPLNLTVLMRYVYVCCRSSGAKDLVFNLRELTEPTEVKASMKKPSKAGCQFDSRFGVGDRVTVLTSKKTDSENKVSTLSSQT